MVKDKNRVLDIVTGAVVGALFGLHYSLVDYHMILVVTAIVLGIRVLKLI